MTCVSLTSVTCYGYIRLTTFQKSWKDRKKSLDILIWPISNKKGPILGVEAAHITYYKANIASEGNALIFIFTSYSSMKGSFVVYWLIDFNEKHSFVAKGRFDKLNFVFLSLVLNRIQRRDTAVWGRAQDFWGSQPPWHAHNTPKSLTHTDAHT